MPRSAMPYISRGCATPLAKLFAPMLKLAATTIASDPICPIEAPATPASALSSPANWGPIAMKAQMIAM